MAKDDPTHHAADLLTALFNARKTLGLPVRKQLAFEADSPTSGSYGSRKGGSYGGSEDVPSVDPAFATPSPATTSQPALASDRSAALSGGSTTSGSQTAASSEKAKGDKNPSGGTAAAVVGTLIGLVVVGVLSLFAWKQYKKSRTNNQRYSTYSTFDNEMGVRY